MVVSFELDYEFKLVQLIHVLDIFNKIFFIDFSIAIHTITLIQNVLVAFFFLRNFNNCF